MERPVQLLERNGLDEDGLEPSRAAGSIRAASDTSRLKTTSGIERDQPRRVR